MSRAHLRPGRPAALAAFATLAALAGCRLDLAYDDAMFQCDDARGCVAGQTCVAGTCVAVPDGGAPPGDVGEDTCASASTLHDAFDGDTLVGWEPFGSSSVITVTGGALVLEVVNPEPGNHAAVRSHEAYDLREGAVEIEVVEATARRARLLVLDDALGAVAGTSLATGKLSFDLELGGTPVPGPEGVVHDPVEHRHWRVVGEGGRLRWETSPDRAGWTVHRDEPVPASLRYARILLEAIEAPATSSRGVVRIAALNPDAPPVSWCGPDELTDAFDGPAVGPQWVVHDDVDCRVMIFQGQLTFSLEGAEAWCGVESRRPFDLRGGAVTLEALAIEAPLEARLGTLDGAVRILADPMVGVTIDRNGESLNAGVAPEDARWWRFVGAAEDEIVIELAGYDGAFVEVARATGVAGLDEARLLLSTAGGAGGVAAVDDVNLPP